MEELIEELKLVSPSVSRAIYRRYFNKSFIYDDLNEYIHHDSRFQTEMQHLFLKNGLHDDQFDFGRITDFKEIPSKLEKSVIKVLVLNAYPQYVRLKVSHKPTPERDGFFHSICSAFRVLPGTKRWGKLARYFNEIAKERHENQFKNLRKKNIEIIS